jgi:hypothetical protein
MTSLSKNGNDNKRSGPVLGKTLVLGVQNWLCYVGQKTLHTQNFLIFFFICTLQASI